MIRTYKPAFCSVNREINSVDQGRRMTSSMRLISQFAFLAVVAIVLGGAEAKPPKRVVNGEDAEIGEFPYQASVRKNDKHVCGGTVIGKRHILTAAHCIDEVSENPAKEMTVVTGTNALAPGAGNSNKIKTVTIHPNYKNTFADSWENDIAVIALEKDITFDMFTKEAKLPSSNTKPDLECIASGWGIMSFPKGLQPNNMRKVTMTTLENKKCALKHPKMQIFDSHVCAFATMDVGLCTGDSGGPLAYNGEVHGIASWTTPCARGNPDVFTRVHFYLDFIKESMKST